MPTSVAQLGGKSQNISLEHRGTIPSARPHVRRKSGGLVHLGQGGPDHPSGERGGKEKAGGDEDGGGEDGGGEEGTVDDLPPGTCWLGKDRLMPWTVKEKNIKYFLNTHFICICLKIHLIFLYISFRIKCWKEGNFFICRSCISYISNTTKLAIDFNQIRQP